MRRPALLTCAALGGVICLLGGTGLFAALTDTARSGTNSAESAPMAASADIGVASADVEVTNGETSYTCDDAFFEDLTTAFFTVQNVTPGFASSSPGETFSDDGYCITNAGSQAVNLSVVVDELSDLDFDCTGDEGLHGDANCAGESADPVGELSSVLEVQYLQSVSCGPEAAFENIHTTSLANGAAAPTAQGSLAPGQTRCFQVVLRYPTGTPIAEQQRAQSDRATWRFKWIAQA